VFYCRICNCFISTNIISFIVGSYPTMLYEETMMKACMVRNTTDCDESWDVMVMQGQSLSSLRNDTVIKHEVCVCACACACACARARVCVCVCVCVCNRVLLSAHISFNCFIIKPWHFLTSWFCWYHLFLLYSPIQYLPQCSTGDKYAILNP
jgi:hypothetical protein